MRTLVQQFETLHSQITVQSTTGNKAKLTFQMIKLKHYHYVPHFFFSSPRSQQLVWQFRAGRGEAHLWFQFRAAGLRGQAGRCPSGAGQVSALLRLNAHWWLLWWCGGSHGGVVINISSGLIPLVHKQRLELLWELSTKVCGPLRAAELHSHHTTSGLSGQLLVSHQMRTVGQPMRGLNSRTETWSQRLASGEMVAEIWGLEHGSAERPQGTASNWLGDSAALLKRKEA